MLTSTQRVQQHTVLLWEYLYRRVTGRAKYRLDLRKNNQQALLDNFTKKLQQGPGLAAAGKDYLVRYFAFQFAYWSDKSTEQTLSPAWVLGSKAWGRWQHMQQENARYGEQQAAEKMEAAGLPLSELRAIFTQSSEERPDPVRGYGGEEVEKRLYYNTPEGFLHCLSATTLYQACPTCFGCVHRVDCRATLERRSPILYAKRFPQQ